MRLPLLITTFVAPILTTLDAEAAIGLLFGHYGPIAAFTHLTCLALYGLFFLAPPVSAKPFNILKCLPLLLSVACYFLTDSIFLQGALLLFRTYLFSFFSAQLLRHMIYPKNSFSKKGWRLVNGGVFIVLVLCFLSPANGIFLDQIINWTLPIVLLFLSPLEQRAPKILLSKVIYDKRFLRLALFGAIVNSLFFFFLSQVAIMQKNNLLIYLVVMHLAYCLVAPKVFSKLSQPILFFLTIIPFFLLLFGFRSLSELLNWQTLDFSLLHLLFIGGVSLAWFLSLWVHASNLEINLSKSKESVFFGVYVLQYCFLLAIMSISFSLSPIVFKDSVLAKAENLIPWERHGVKRSYPERRAQELKSFKYGLNIFRHIKVEDSSRQDIEYFVFNDHFTRWSDGGYFRSRMEFLKNYLSSDKNNIQSILIMGLGNYKALKVALENSSHSSIYVVDNFIGYGEAEFRSYISSLLGTKELTRNKRIDFRNESIESFLVSNAIKFDLVYDNLTSPNFSSSTRLFSSNFSDLLAQNISKKGIFISQYTGTREERCSYLSSFLIVDSIVRMGSSEKVGLIAKPIKPGPKGESKCSGVGLIRYFSYYFFKL